jgi:hypothetical protein
MEIHGGETAPFIVKTYVLLAVVFRAKRKKEKKTYFHEKSTQKQYYKNWCVPFGTQRVEAEGTSKNEQIH